MQCTYCFLRSTRSSGLCSNCNQPLPPPPFNPAFSRPLFNPVARQYAYQPLRGPSPVPLDQNQPLSPTDEQDVKDLQQRLEKFYKRENPAKIKDCRLLAEKYFDCEDDLWVSILRKYPGSIRVRTLADSLEDVQCCKKWRLYWKLLFSLIFTLFFLITNTYQIIQSKAILDDQTALSTTLGGCCSQYGNNSYTCCGNSYQNSNLCCQCYSLYRTETTTDSAYICTNPPSSGPVSDCNRFFIALTHPVKEGFSKFLFFLNYYHFPTPDSFFCPSSLEEYGCEDSTCLKQPPALSTATYRGSLNYYIGAQVTIVLKLCLSEVMYYRRAFSVKRYHARPTCLGLLWGWNNDDYWQFLLSKGSFNLSLSDCLFDIWINVFNTVAGIAKITVLYFGGFPESDIYLPIISCFLACLKILYSIIGYFKQGVTHLSNACYNFLCCERTEEIDNDCCQWRLFELFFSLLILIVSLWFFSYGLELF